MDGKLIISAVGLVVSVAAFFLGRFTWHRERGEKDGEKSGAISSDIGYIKAGIDNMQKELRDMREGFSLMRVKIAALEEKLNSHQMQIDELKGGGKG